MELDQGRLCLFVIARLLVDSRRPQQLPTTAFTCQLEYVLLANGSLFLAVAIFFTIFVGNFPALVQYLFVAEVVVDPSSQLWTTRTGGGGGGGKQRRDPGGVSC